MNFKHYAIKSSLCKYSQSIRSFLFTKASKSFYFQSNKTGVMYTVSPFSLYNEYCKIHTFILLNSTVAKVQFRKMAYGRFIKDHQENEINFSRTILAI